MFVHHDAISPDPCPLLFMAYLFCLDSVFCFYFNTGNFSASLVFPSHTHTYTHRRADKRVPRPPLACSPYYEYSNVKNLYLCSTGPKIDQRTSEYQIEAKSPLKISSILFTSQRCPALTCQKTPLSCSVRSQLLFYTSGLFRLGWRLCGFPSIIWSVEMRTLRLCEYSVV